MRSIERKFYEDRAWRDCQKAYMKKVNRLCEKCLANGKIEPARIVHHKIPLTEKTIGNLELMYGFDNLMAVCSACHNEIHGNAKSTRRWTFEDGELITRGE